MKSGFLLRVAHDLVGLTKNHLGSCSSVLLAKHIDAPHPSQDPLQSPCLASIPLLPSGNSVPELFLGADPTSDLDLAVANQGIRSVRR